MLLSPFVISLLRISLIFPRFSIPYFENLNYSQKMERGKLVIVLRQGVIQDIPFKKAMAMNSIKTKTETALLPLARKISGKGTYLERIHRALLWVRRNIKYDVNDKEEDPLKIMRRKRASCIGLSSLSSSLLQSIGIPTKIATGYIIRDKRPVPHRWIEIYFPGQGWAFFDPQREIEGPDYIFMGYNQLRNWPIFSLKTLRVKKEISN